jgi:hypothetical protein
LKKKIIKTELRTQQTSNINKEMNHIKQTKDENEIFLFTSESVGEGHPGKHKTQFI